MSLCPKPTYLLVATALLAITTAHADSAATKARQLFDQGLAQYKASDYTAAASTLRRSYELDPRPEALFAWAQAERLAGNCDAAVPLYRKLTDASSDLGTARLVHDNLARCEPGKPAEPEGGGEPAEPEGGGEPTVPAPAPTTVSRPTSPAPVIRRHDPASTALLAGGSLALGAGVGLFVASIASEGDADRARTYDDHLAIADRASTQRTVAYVAGGVGAAMIGFAVFRILRTSEERAPATVSVSTTSDGASVSLSGRW